MISEPHFVRGWLSQVMTHTIKALMGQRDVKNTEQYIRAHRLTRQVALVEKNVHKLATNEWGEPLR
jgi:hypothetical protein